MGSKFWARIKRPLSALLAVLLLAYVPMTAGSQVNAASSDEIDKFQNNSSVKKQTQKIADIDKKIADSKKKIASLKNDIDGLLKKKDEYDALIEEYQNKLDATEELIGMLEEEEKSIKDDIDKKLSESADLYERIKARMVVSYKSGGSRATYLELIFGAEDLFDFVVGISNAVRFMEYDTNLMDEYKAVTEGLENDYALHEASLKTQQDLKASLEASEQETQTLLDECTATMKKVQEQVAKNESAADKLEEERKKADAELDAIIEELIKKNGATQNVAEGEYMWPLETRYRTITSYFGNRKDPINGKPSNHGALDIYAPIGSTIYATNNGTVVTSLKSSGSYGNYIMIDHGGNVFSLYAHCSQLLVSEGTYVTKGTPIAKVGVTGRVTGPHLHFEMRNGKTRVDPLGYVTRP